MGERFGRERRGEALTLGTQGARFSAVGSVPGTLSTMSALYGRQVGRGWGEVPPALRICEWRPDHQSPGNVSEMESILWDSPSRSLDHVLCDTHSCALAVVSGSILKPYMGMIQLMAWAICLCYQSQLLCSSKGKYGQLLIPQNALDGFKQNCQQIIYR